MVVAVDEDYPLLGRILYHKNNRAKHFIARPTAIGEWKVTIPRGGSLSSAKKFVEEREEELAKMAKDFAQKNDFIIQDGYKTHYHTIVFRKHDKNKLAVTQNLDKKGEYIIWIPQNLALENDQPQEFAKQVLLRLWKWEAKQYLPKRIEELAQKWGMKFSRLSLRNNKGRWGSCSTNGNISLNIQLMGLPLHLIDYVILHELAHTIHHNHSPKFWGKLDEMTEQNYKELINEMKNQSILR